MSSMFPADNGLGRSRRSVGGQQQHRRVAGLVLRRALAERARRRRHAGGARAAPAAVAQPALRPHRRQYQLQRRAHAAEHQH